ncbi:Porphobilinogen deaminase [hydrothermal vent metagenome]|uniref:Porphobilinogen deaminase n=1 Tax=hydrothermal vent metagenome TaxID=652676 RepID=A0A1W1EB87_9ZZZZ
MGQAALGIEIVSDNDRVREIVMTLNDEKSFLCTKLERDFVSAIGAGCSAPVAVNAVISENEITVKAMLGYPDGTNIMHRELTANIDECELLGLQLAEDMIADGAIDILEKAEEIAFKDEMPERL